jgi:hypothetical protein
MASSRAASELNASSSVASKLVEAVRTKSSLRAWSRTELRGRASVPARAAGASRATQLRVTAAMVAERTSASAKSKAHCAAARAS